MESMQNEQYNHDRFMDLLVKSKLFWISAILLAISFTFRILYNNKPDPLTGISDMIFAIGLSFFYLGGGIILGRLLEDDSNGKRELKE